MKLFKLRAIRPQISQINCSEDNEDQPIFEETAEEVLAIQRRSFPLIPTCWNCGTKGHKFVDCVGPRSIFCYGCGAKDAYKPVCSKCTQAGNMTKDLSSRNSQTHP